MDRATFVLIQQAARHAEKFLKWDPECWLNKLGKPIHVVVAIKGHHMKPEIPGRPTMSAQAVFGHNHRNRCQKKKPFTEDSTEFRNLAAKWGKILILIPIKPSQVKSHQPKNRPDLANVFSVGASGRRSEQNSMAAVAFEKVMKVFLKEFEEEFKGEYNEEIVRIFSEKMRARLSRVRKVQVPSMKTLEGEKGTILKST